MTLPGKETDKRAVAERMSELWQPLSEAQRAYLTAHIELCRYQKDDLIYGEGEVPQHLSCLLQGKVKIFKDGIGGRHQIVRMGLSAISAIARASHWRTTSRRHRPSSRRSSAVSRWKPSSS